jgi:hypothetical protein
LNAESLSVEHVPAPPIAPAPVLSQPRSHASALLETSEHSTWADEARRLATAASLAAVFGVALGLRHGGLSLASGAAGAPLGILAVGALAAPALVILLALANAPIDALDLGRATTRAAAKAGMLLAGVAPLAALFVVTVEDAITVTCVGFGALILAGGVAARSFYHDLAARFDKAPASTSSTPRRSHGRGVASRFAMHAAVWAFLAFSGALALRVWVQTLPMLTEPQTTPPYVEPATGAPGAS